MDKTTLYLPRELKQALTSLARERRCSEAELLREAVARLTRRRGTCAEAAAVPRVGTVDRRRRGSGAPELRIEMIVLDTGEGGTFTCGVSPREV